MAVAEGTWTWTGVTAVLTNCFLRNKKSPESEHQNIAWLKPIRLDYINCYEQGNIQLRKSPLPPF